jgi:phage gp46-like protein
MRTMGWRSEQSLNRAKALSLLQKPKVRPEKVMLTMPTRERMWPLSLWILLVEKDLTRTSKHASYAHLDVRGGHGQQYQSTSLQLHNK